MRQGLFESMAWLGPQAFYFAKAFNANIGAWNTASIANMVSVCALIAIASVCEVCASCMLSCFTHFSSIIMCTTDITEALSGFAPAQPPQLRRISIRLCAACVRLRRPLFMRPSMERTQR